LSPAGSRDRGAADARRRIRSHVGTDPVALDRVGCAVVEQLRRDDDLPTLAHVGREPAYLRRVGELGLGIADLDRIRLRDVKL